MRTLSRQAIWRAPLLIAVASAAGLILALLFDGPGDLLGWSLLSVPVLVALWSLTPRRQRALRQTAEEAFRGHTRRTST